VCNACFIDDGPMNRVGARSEWNHLIFASYKKAYGTRGYEAETLTTIIIVKREEIHPGHAIAPLVWS
jgi:hypothetical protein